MSRYTNKLILKYSLLPLVTFLISAYLFPEMIAATDNPGLVNYVGVTLFALAGGGVLVFWFWGIGANMISLMIDPFENEQRAGRLKPGSYEDRALQSMAIFRFLRIYIKRS